MSDLSIFMEIASVQKALSFGPGRSQCIDITPAIICKPIRPRIKSATAAESEHSSSAFTLLDLLIETKDIRFILYVITAGKKSMLWWIWCDHTTTDQLEKI